MTLTPEGLLELFNIDFDGRGAAMWRRFVWAMYDDHKAASAAIAEVCRAEGVPRAAAYSLMKRALAPVFEMPPEAWEALGLRQQTTTSGLARELAEAMRKGHVNG